MSLSFPSRGVLKYPCSTAASRVSASTSERSEQPSTSVVAASAFRLHHRPVPHRGRAGDVAAVVPDHAHRVGLDDGGPDVGPLYAGLEVARGGLGYTETALAVSLLITAEKATDMLCQPYTGRLSDRAGRSLFVFVGGGAYGLVALAVPFTPAIGGFVGAPETFPLVGTLSAAFLPLLTCNALLGVADSLREPASMALFADEGTEDGSVASSFGIRELVWRPGSVLAPMLRGALMGIGMQWVFFVGAAAAFSGIFTFFGILARDHGARALTQWQ
jgi:MFS family permease